jgi:prefoldin subunit 5
LTTICAKLGALCDAAIQKLGSKIKELDAQIQELDQNIGTSRKLKNQALYLLSELDTFNETYLQPDV